MQWLHKVVRCLGGFSQTELDAVNRPATFALDDVQRQPIDTVCGAQSQTQFRQTRSRGGADWAKKQGQRVSATGSQLYSSGFFDVEFALVWPGQYTRTPAG